jgi:putative ABC transport system permease protein
MSVGIFSAQAARTINLNAEHEIRYSGGTDLIIQELWHNNVMDMIFAGAEELTFFEPSFERFVNMEEAEALTRVMNTTVQASNRRTGNTQRLVPGANLLAIEPHSFGETAWFRDDFLPVHINYYLNVLSQVPNGVLVSENFRDMGFVLGDAMSLQHTRTIPVPGGPSMVVQSFAPRVIIVGFIERWPTFEPLTRRELADGNIINTDNHLVVGNLGYFRNIWGVWPYEIWMRTNTYSNRFIHDFISENNLRTVPFQDIEVAANSGRRTGLIAVDDVTADIARNRLDPLIQGTNGVYWILSIRSRVLQFGIFRAMGMRMHGIIRLLINEQIFITLTALGIGAFVGELAARYYVPLIQLSYSAVQRPIPLLVVVELRDYINLYGVLGIMIVLCLIILFALLARMRVAQVLKLGED